MARRIRVALLIESSREYGRGLLRGIAEYARTHGGWSIYHHERSLADAPPRWLRQWSGDGLIVRAESLQMVRLVRRLHVPAVDLRALHTIPGVPAVDTDDLAVSRMAARHLMERGFRNFAYCGFAGANYSDARCIHGVPAKRGIRRTSIFRAPAERRSKHHDDRGAGTG